MSSSILKRILENAASRPVSPEDSQAVKTLRLRVAAAAPPTPEEMGRAVQPVAHAHQIPVRPRLPLAERIALAAAAIPEASDEPTTPIPEQMGPGTAVRHMEHLERQVAMAEMRLKETRQQLAEMAARFGEAAVDVALMEHRYEELDSSDIAEWVEKNVFPRLREVLGMPAGEKGGAL
jgi:hypothetical protein